MDILFACIAVRSAPTRLWIAKPALWLFFLIWIPSFKLAHGKFRRRISIAIIKDERTELATDAEPFSAIGKCQHIEPSAICKLPLDIFTICIWLHFYLPTFLTTPARTSVLQHRG